MKNKYFDNIIVFGSSGYVGKSLKNFFMVLKNLIFCLYQEIIQRI